MKVLTKEWALKHEQLRFIYNLKAFDEQKETYERIKKKSQENYFNTMRKDEELAKLVVDTSIFSKLYETQVEKNRKVLISLPKKIFTAIKDIKTLVLGYACKQDKKLLTFYAKEVLVGVEEDSKRANRINEISEEYLPNEFSVDDIVGELLFEEYSNENDYFINAGGHKICIENYKIIEREDFKVNEWEEDNPLSEWTVIYSAELHRISKGRYELHLLLVNGDKYANEKCWYFTISGSNVKEF